MIKDNIRDYAVGAFRFYAKLGKPTYEEYKRKMYNYAVSVYKDNDLLSETEKEIKAQKLFQGLKPEIEDIRAVESVMKKLEKNPDAAPLKRIVEIVYFQNPGDKYERSDITYRVHKAEIEAAVSEAGVYRYLKKVRIMFAEERGLRIG